MAKHEFGIMPTAPVPGQRFDEYEPRKRLNGTLVMLEELKGELNVEDFNGSVEIEFDGDDVMKLTDDDDVIMKFRRM